MNEVEKMRALMERPAGSEASGQHDRVRDLAEKLIMLMSKVPTKEAVIALTTFLTVRSLKDNMGGRDVREILEAMENVVLNVMEEEGRSCDPML